MADDLDELLDEVESKFCRSIAVSPATTSICKQDGEYLSKSKTHPERKVGTNGYAKKVSPLECVEDDDIDAFLEDILHEDFDSLGKDMPKTVKNVAKNALLCPASKKCCPVFLGGSSVESGLGTSTSQRACDQLRCTSCDFRVTAFDDYEWDPSCNYLFFRNNMPSRDKLRTKLRKRKGTRAYACQCSWHSAVCLTDLSRELQFKWVCCGKHQA